MSGQNGDLYLYINCWSMILYAVVGIFLQNGFEYVCVRETFATAKIKRMKHYYISQNDEQLGPFTFDELKAKRLKKSTLVWYDGLTEWISADIVEELKDILVAEPPPLPKKEKTKQPEIINQSPLVASEIKSKHNPKYIREIAASNFGVLLLIISLLFSALLSLYKSESTENYNETKELYLIISLVVRILVTISVIGIAKRQNRDSTGWGFLAFFFPSIALIIIGRLQKLNSIYSNINSKIVPLKELMDREKKGAFVYSSHSEILQFLNNFCTTKENCVKLLEEYKLQFNSNLIDDLKALYSTSTYDKIKETISVFIKFNIVEEKFPHEIIEVN